MELHWLNLFCMIIQYISPFKLYVLEELKFCTQQSENTDCSTCTEAFSPSNPPPPPPLDFECNVEAEEKRKVVDPSEVGHSTDQGFLEVVGVDAGQSQLQQWQDVAGPLRVVLAGAQHGAGRRHHAEHAGNQAVRLNQSFHGRVHSASTHTHIYIYAHTHTTTSRP